MEISFVLGKPGQFCEICQQRALCRRLPPWTGKTPHQCRQIVPFLFVPQQTASNCGNHPQSSKDLH